MWKPWIERITDGYSDRCHIWRLHLIDWPFRLYLHNIQRPDSDRELHNHPRPFISFILWGSYLERCQEHPREAPYLQVRERLHFNVMPVTRFHRITEVEKNTWTILLGRYRKESVDWGFLQMDGTLVPHEQWTARNEPDHTHTNTEFQQMTSAEAIEHLRTAHHLPWKDDAIGYSYASQIHFQIHPIQFFTKFADGLPTD